MFELSIALKYLIPKKKHLSVTLIALLSTTVIALVVWLLLVFLSVTDGMEKTWIDKLTTLHAPLRITPTSAYFSSYYYKIDSISFASGFASKTLQEKLQAPITDPYNKEEDREIPSSWPLADLNAQGNLIDPVKELALILEHYKQENPNFLFQDYEMSGGMLKLQLLRNRSPSPFVSGQESINFLTQMSYLATPPESSTILSSLITTPSIQDITHLFFLAGYRMGNTLSDESPQVKLAQEEFHERLFHLFECIQIETLQFSQLPISLLPEGESFVVHAKFKEGSLQTFFLPPHSHSPLPSEPGWEKGSAVKEQGSVLFSFVSKTFSYTSSLPLAIPMIAQSQLQKDALTLLSRVQDIPFLIKTSLQEKQLTGITSWQNASIHSFTLLSTKDFSLSRTGEKGILLPKSFQDNGILLGDKGFISYSSSTASAILEQRIPVFISGFYDPGILSIGSKCLLVPREITKTINAANSTLVFDKIDLNGFQVWIDSPLQKAQLLQKNIQKDLQKKGLQSYWKVSSFQEYDFAKDLLQQFQSDRYLFSLVGIIILLVACCNIFSFLLLLVNDKKKEIAILQAMGAGKKSITSIFGLCGIVVGCLGCAVGVGLAILTLSNMDTIVCILSALQGHEAFHQSFYGTSLPSSLSSDALIFICFATPILSLLAGLIPACKACRLNPSSLLRTSL